MDWPFIHSVGNFVSSHAAAIQAVATVAAAVIALFYLIATHKLWRETRTGNLLTQLEYFPDVFVSIEDPSKFGYWLVFSNQSRLGVVVECDLFIDFADCPGPTKTETSKRPVKHLEFNLAPGSSRKIRIDTFFELAKRGLGQYAPHRLRVEGEACIRSSVRQEEFKEIKQPIQESFYCIMYSRAKEFIPANELLNPDRWEWSWHVFNLSEQQTSSEDSIDPWPEDELPEEYQPKNNNTTLYMEKRLKKNYGWFFAGDKE